MGTRTYSRRGSDGVRRPTALGIRMGRFLGEPRIGEGVDGQQSVLYGAGRRWNPYARKAPVRVANLEQAFDEIEKGNYVEMDSPEQVFSAIRELADYVKDVKERTGKDLPNLDLCRISVPGTNLFCGSSIATERFPEGIPRKKMPQLSGIPLPGTAADELPRFDKEGNVDISGSFIQRLADAGIATSEPRDVPAASLKASQHQLSGATVNFMASPAGQEVLNNPNSVIYVSRDGYIIDGHHRWAGKIAQDLSDGRTGDVTIRVRVIDMPILEVLDAAFDHAQSMGVKVNTI